VAGRRILVISTIIVALASFGAWYELEHANPVHEKTAAVAVPVAVAIASRGDLPIYQTGLGVVQASFTVGIRPQVDGKLEQVLFKEGENVRKGDVLAKIDPRLYQATLDQASSWPPRSLQSRLSSACWSAPGWRASGRCRRAMAGPVHSLMPSTGS
jgi:multidrug efflux pump subunit AcrA (membrane-fusion protein)